MSCHRALAAAALSAVALLVGAIGAPLRGQPFGPAQETTVLRAGDIVRITVWRLPELSGEFTVSASGALAHPLYRAVPVAGIPLAQAEERVLEFLRRFDPEPQIVLEPLLRVAVGGEVDRPDLYTLRPETTILEALAIAGGPTDRGRRDRLVLVRGGRSIVVDLASPEAGAGRAPIRSGDEIVIERRRSIFREYVAPALTVSGATAAIVNVIIRAQR